jgi:hypothetical protein
MMMRPAGGRPTTLNLWVNVLVTNGKPHGATEIFLIMESLLLSPMERGCI